MTMFFPCARTSSELARRRMRFFSSGADFLSQKTLGTTPNMAPPSSQKLPPSRYRTSMSSKCMESGPDQRALFGQARSSQDFGYGGKRILFAFGHFDRKGAETGF